MILSGSPVFTASGAYTMTLGSRFLMPLYNTGPLWFAGPDSQDLWRDDADGWQQESHITGGTVDIGSVYEDKKGTLWVAASWAGLWRYGADSWQLIPQVIRERLKSIKTGWLHVSLWWKGNLAL